MTDGRRESETLPMQENHSDWIAQHTLILGKAAIEWSVFVSGVDLRRSRVLSGPPDRC